MLQDGSTQDGSMQDDFRIFLSAVTGAFGRARNAVTADLRSRGLTRRNNLAGLRRDSAPP